MKKKAIYLILFLAIAGITTGCQKNENVYPKVSDLKADKLYDELPEKAKQVYGEIHSVEDFERVSEKLNIEPKLYNFNYATKSTMKGFGELEGTVSTHIPVQISKLNGGRKSIYFLDKGERVNTGFFITSSGAVYHRYIEKLTGMNGKPNNGDKYMDILVDENNQEVYNEIGTLQIIDFEKGYGQMTFETNNQTENLLLTSATSSKKKTCTKVWIYWSCLYIERKKEEKGKPEEAKPEEERPKEGKEHME